MSVLLEPFAYRYMIDAIWVSALVGGVCAFLSAYLMLKGWSLIGDALSHSIVPGVAGAYILGLPLTDCGAGASPLCVWEGSHIIMRRAFEAALSDVPQDAWDRVDLTEIYQAARRDVFETCPRRLVPAKPGESYIVHRLALHGVAPWEDGAEAPDEGRMVVYFRPEWTETRDQWLTAP